MPLSLNLSQTQAQSVVSVAGNPPKDPKSDLYSVLAILGLGLTVVVLLFFLLNNAGKDVPTPVDGRYVIFFEDVNERLALTDDQKSILTSVPLRKTCDELNILVRKFDINENLVNEDPIYTHLREKAEGPFPSMLMVSKKGSTETRIPEDADRTIQLIKKEFK